MRSYKFLVSFVLLALASPHVGFSQGLIGWAENRSVPTTCAEEDNINIPLFCPGLQRYRIVATHPTYCPCEYDGCPADFSGCPPDGDPVTETAYKIWDDGINVIEVVVLSQWWRSFAMTVTTGTTSRTGHYLRLYRKIPDAQSWPQVLVLYQDGNLRIKPYPPPGVSDVCFGSSVIVGPAQLAERPYVDIEEVQVAPRADRIAFSIKYRAGGTAGIEFRVNRAEAQTIVDVGYAIGMETPFATFRSMWVTNGNADVDHVTHSGGTFPILTGWTRLEGLWWRFWRAMDSRHNRSAPDIYVLLDTSNVFRLERESGNVYADGGYWGASFHTGDADLAELVRVNEPVEPGDVLEVDPVHPGCCRKAQGSCSPFVAGVVSSKPGMMLGWSGEGLELVPLALMGVVPVLVPVKVTDEGGPIRPGDLLVVSSAPSCSVWWNHEH